MNEGDRAGLIARIRHVRRITADRDQPISGGEPSQDEQVRTLEARVAHLEHQLDGLQDSVHRESERHSKLIAELQAQVQPGAISAALADDARTRGL
jgi:hypothetical protein